MGRATIDRSKRAILGARINEKFKEYQREGKEKGETRTQTTFGKLFDPPASRRSVAKWCSGENIPKPDRLKRMCEIFGVTEDYFNTDDATHDEKYQHEGLFITKIGRENVEFAKKEGLNLDLVRALSKAIDFNKLFPVYAPINNRKTEVLGERDSVKIAQRVWARSTPADSAPIPDPEEIDEDLQFLQVVQNGTRITFHRGDLAFLKEVQDQVIDYVEFLFYQRSKEMDQEVRKFNEDLTPEDFDENGRPKPEFILEHDRFAKVFEGIVKPDRKEGE